MPNGGASALYMDSNYNLGGLTNRIKARLKDVEYSDEDVHQFINDAYFDILGDTAYQFLEKVYVSSTQQSDPLLLPRDYQTLIHLTAKIDNGIHPLHYIPSRQFFNADKDAGIKNYTYTIFGNQLLYSLPNVEDQLGSDGDEKFYQLFLYYGATFGRTSTRRTATRQLRLRSNLRKQKRGAYYQYERALLSAPARGRE